MGLATRISDDPIEAGLMLAREIACHSTSALRHAKRLLDMAGHVDLADGLDAEQDAVVRLIGSEEQMTAVRRRLAQ